MRINIRLGALLSIALLLVVTLIRPFPTAHAYQQIGPLDLSGEINGAPYRIIVPENWNGTLLVFARGYRDKADHPGEVNNRNVDLAPATALVHHCWLRVTHWLDPLLKITVGPLRMAFRTRKILRFSSELTWPSQIARSYGPFRLERSSASKAWNSLAASTMAHSARVVKAREPFGFGTAACPVFFPTMLFLESPAPGGPSEKSETT